MKRKTTKRKKKEKGIKSKKNKNYPEVMDRNDMELLREQLLCSDK